MEKEQDKAVRNFEENNEIIFFLNEKTENVMKNTDARFYGIANEQTKSLGNFFNFFF